MLLVICFKGFSISLLIGGLLLTASLKVPYRAIRFSPHTFVRVKVDNLCYLSIRNFLLSLNTMNSEQET